MNLFLIITLSNKQKKKHEYNFSFRKNKFSADLQHIKYMKSMKATKHAQTRVQLCDRRYSDIDLMNNFISQKLQVRNSMVIISLKKCVLCWIFIILKTICRWHSKKCHGTFSGFVKTHLIRVFVKGHGFHVSYRSPEQNGEIFFSSS